jgi:DNA-directed RNA polymerase specialized sigma subunit
MNADFLKQYQTINADVDNIETEFTSQDKIAYLSRYKAVDKRIEQELEELAKWDCRATKVTPTYSDMPKGGETSDKIQTAVEEMDEIRMELQSDLQESRIIMRGVKEAIKTVEDDTLKNVLLYRYINGKTFEQIAVKLDFSYQWVCELHGRALKKVRILDSN